MKPRIEAYIADWGFHQDLTKEQADCLTHVNYSFGHVVDGRVSIDHLEQRPRLEKLQKDFPHLKVNLSVGGWGADGFSQAVATAEGRELLASTAMDQATQSGVAFDSAAITPETMKMATIVASVLPILIIYPFIQKYFVKGVMVGSIKG